MVLAISKHKKGKIKVYSYELNPTPYKMHFWVYVEMDEVEDMAPKSLVGRGRG